MNEIKSDPTLKKSNFLVSFMLLFTIIKLLPILFDTYVGKLIFFQACSRYFGLVQHVQGHKIG